MGELEAVIALVFRKKGKTSMPEKDFVFAASLDLRLCTPKEAQRVLDLAIESELLARESGNVRPAFDFQGMEIPKGFKPDMAMLEKGTQPRTIFMKLVEELAAKTGLPTKEIISQVNSVQDRMSIEVEVAVLVTAKSLGVDMAAQMDIVEEEIGRRHKA